MGNQPEIVIASSGGVNPCGPRTQEGLSQNLEPLPGELHTSLKNPREAPTRVLYVLPEHPVISRSRLWEPPGWDGQSLLLPVMLIERDPATPVLSRTGLWHLREKV
jgi:hypothetical protein